MGVITPPSNKLHFVVVIVVVVFIVVVVVVVFVDDNKDIWEGELLRRLSGWV